MGVAAAEGRLVPDRLLPMLPASVAGNGGANGGNGHAHGGHGNGNGHAHGGHGPEDHDVATAAGGPAGHA